MPHKMNPQKIYQMLCKIAMEDGIVSDSEQTLIDMIKKNIEKYYVVLDEAFDDNVITTEEHFNFYNLRKKVIDEAIKVAKADETISPDEFKLLKALQSILEEVEVDEHY